jgi:anti-sigma regulatory factor (Ser/Thr protein kinase)
MTSRASASLRAEETLAFVVSGGHEAGLATRGALLEGDGTLPAGVRDDLLLLVTELVTNAVRHGGVGPERSLGIQLRRRPGRVRVEVVDPTAGFTPVHARAKGGESGGWGLFLLDRIADRWGIRRLGSGTCAWFELRFEEPIAASGPSRAAGAALTASR